MTDSTFDKTSRLLSATDFANLKVGSKVFKKSSLIAYYKQNSLGKTRVGLSVSKKNGNSPIRNRCKRILRELFRHSSIRELGLDILLVVNFHPSLKNDEQAKKESVLLENTNDFFHFLSVKK